MKKMLVATFVLLLCCTPALCQQQLNAATKEDLEELMTLTGTKARIEQMWAQMGQQAATTAADSYRLKHPDATPLELRKVAEVTGTSFQNVMKVFSVDELIDAVIPVYQRHLTHADVRAIIDFYNSEAGQKYLKELPIISAETTQVVQPIITKHLPEMQAAADKAVEDSLKDAPATQKESSDASK
jgi:uncharacterized protein